MFDQKRNFLSFFTFQENILENLNFNGNFFEGKSNERRVVIWLISPIFSGLSKDKKLLCGRLNVKGRIFTLICWIWNWSFSKSRSHFLQLVKGMTDRQTLSATFRNSTLEFYSDIPKLSEAQNEMCSQLGVEPARHKAKKFLNLMDFCFEYKTKLLVFYFPTQKFAPFANLVSHSNKS